MTEVIKSSYWKLLVDFAKSFNDEAYADFVTKWPLSYYIARVRQLNFTSMDAVLDVGCGYGQWTIALAALNKKVVGIDQHKNRISVGNELCKKLWVKNISFQQASATQLPFPDSSFDGVFCYGVFMFLQKDEALAEFRRVLKPGGKLYICTNARGWWLELAYKNLLKNFNLFKTGIKAFCFGHLWGLPNSTEISHSYLFPPEKWGGVSFAMEGGLSFNKTLTAKKPVYEGKFLGFNRVIEIVAHKTPILKRQTENINCIYQIYIDKLINEVEENHRNAYHKIIDLYKFEDQPDDLVNATNKYSLEYLTDLLNEIDRISALKYLYKSITQKCITDEARVIQCIIFTQRAFYHHFGLQPMIGHNLALLDPLISLFYGACRCGNSARFLVDLLLVNGIEARLIAGSCHTSAEVNIEGRWILADTSLYPPGVIPRNKSNKILSLLDVIQDSELLDAWPSYLNYDSRHVEKFAIGYPATYKQVESWMKFPLYPSSGYFGIQFSNLNGGIRRWSKISPMADWGKDFNFGWNYLSELPVLDGVGCQVSQRPQQVLKIYRNDDIIEWVPAETPYEMDVVYYLRISTEKRCYEYKSEFNFSEYIKSENLIKTRETKINLGGQFKAVRLYVTIYAQDATRPNSYVLPSVEFVF